MGNEWASSFEFWQMTPAQVWWLVGARMPQGPQGGLHDHDDKARILKMIQDSKAKEKAAENG